MAFDTFEESVQDSNPIELYKVEVGNDQFFWTNTDEHEVLFGVNTYLPVSLSRNQFSLDNDQPGSELQITMPTNEPNCQAFARSWVARAPEVGFTRVTVYKKHVSDSEFQTFWVGSIVSVGYDRQGTVTVMLCKSLDNLFTLQGPRRDWGTQCTNQLYDRFCTLSKSLFRQTGTVTAVSTNGLVFTVPGILAPTVRWNSGEFSKHGTFDTRMIVAHSGNNFTVQYPIPSIGVGDVVDIVEGCEHNLTDCAAFNNVINYAGTPFTPPINPFTKGLESI